jgi:tight adherence protein B
MIYIVSLLIAVAAALLINLATYQFRNILGARKAQIQGVAEISLAEMFIFVDPKKLWTMTLVMSFILPLMVYAYAESTFMAILAFIISLLLPSKVVSFLKKKRHDKFEKQLPEALLMLSGAMRAGASFTIALESMVKEQKPPISQEFDLLVREQRMGIDFDTALKHMESRMPTADFMMVVSAMRISREVGGNLAEILDSLAHTLRRKSEMEAKIEGLTAQGRLQGIVMSSLPLLLLFALTKLEPEAMKPLLTEWYGWVTLAVIAFGEWLGYMVIKKIVNIDV